MSKPTISKLKSPLYFSWFPDLSLYILCLLISQQLYSQPDNYDSIQILKKYVEMSYGLDQNIINGMQYFEKYIKQKGHPYLHENVYQKGEIVISGKKYSNVLLMYNIYDKEIQLQFQYQYGGKNEIILNSDEISCFELNNMCFKKYSFPEKGAGYYQLVCNSEISCLYYWYKKLIPEAVDRFTASHKKMYLLINSKPYLFSNTRSLSKLFPEKEKEIRKLLKKYKPLKNLRDEEMNSIILQLNNFLKCKLD